MNESLPDAFLVAAGMVAAVGSDVATNCAAARAGLIRSAPLDNYAARSAVDGDVEAVIGHSAGFLTRGFEGETRLVRLVQAALSDLLEQASGLIEWDGSERFYVSLPDADRTWSGLELIADDVARQKRAEAYSKRLNGEPENSALANASRATRILRKGAASANWPGGDVTATFVTAAGHAGGLHALSAALRDLASGLTRTAVVLGVDSWLDEATLEWLDLTGRLKRDGAPAGLQPGEAGVAIALASQPCVRRSTIIRSRVSEADEARPLLSGTPAVGEALSQVTSQAWASATDDIAWVISDQNGEVYRAYDWGFATVRLRAQFAAFANAVVWHPAASFGDIGAASALAGICMASRAWLRHYAPARTALIVAASDGPPRAAVALTSE